MIRDDQRLAGAISKHGTPIKTYDDGFGPIWIHRDSTGISGIVRAQTWEDAYSICEDEFFPEADETIEELIGEYNIKRSHVKVVREKSTGTARDVKFPEDYPGGKLSQDLEFLRYETREERIDPEVGQVWPENELFSESYGFRPNGPNSTDTLKHAIYAKDLNGDHLDPLTPELVKQLEITLQIENEE